MAAAIKLLAAVAVVVSAAWVIKEPGFKSAVSLIGSISAFDLGVSCGKATSARPQSASSCVRWICGYSSGRRCFAGQW